MHETLPPSDCEWAGAYPAVALIALILHMGSGCFDKWRCSLVWVGGHKAFTKYKAKLADAT